MRNDQKHNMSKMNAELQSPALSQRSILKLRSVSPRRETKSSRDSADNSPRQASVKFNMMPEVQELDNTSSVYGSNSKLMSAVDNLEKIMGMREADSQMHSKLSEEVRAFPRPETAVRANIRELQAESKIIPA